MLIQVWAADKKNTIFAKKKNMSRKNKLGAFPGLEINVGDHVKYVPGYLPVTFTGIVKKVEENGGKYLIYITDDKSKEILSDFYYHFKKI